MTRTDTIAAVAVLGVALAASLVVWAMERPAGDWSAVILSASGREYVVRDGMTLDTCLKTLRSDW